MTAKYAQSFPKKHSTSWENSSSWYGKLVKDEGHYYHEHVILPRLKTLLNIGATHRVLDIGCGEGVFARTLPPATSYVGIDISPSLISLARKRTSGKNKQYVVADAAKPMSSIDNHFSHAVAILSLQNMESASQAIKNVSDLLVRGGQFALVLNHPAFRIPRQSGWETDEGSSEQKRWVKRYMSDLKIPIKTNPGQQQSAVTWSFHRPIEAYAKDLRKAGLMIETIEEWTSDKESTSKFKKREDRARAEIPLFMCIVAKKT